MKFQPFTRKPLTTIIFISLSANLQAADARFCGDYAKTAVKQHIGNIAQSCAEKGPLWSPSYRQHNAWCLGATPLAAAQKTKARHNALASCGADSRKINWNTLPNIPVVWDRLLAQMLVAVKQDDVDAVKVMHSNGVNITYHTSKNNDTVLDHAVKLQAEKTANYLLNQQTNRRAAPRSHRSNALSNVMQAQPVNYQMLGALLKDGFNPNDGDVKRSDASFPLLLAAQKNDYTAVQMMLTAGGNPNLKHEATPLLYAVENRNMSMIQLLLKSGANPNLSHSSTACLPLDKALKSGSRSIINLLKSKGAKAAPNCR